MAVKTSASSDDEDDEEEEEEEEEEAANLDKKYETCAVSDCLRPKGNSTNNFGLLIL